MKESLPSPEFQSTRYDRPIEDWVCGKTADGSPCRIGPDGKGRCRATFECNPALDKIAGEDKGRYSCTRPQEYGGPCELGPLPDGGCRNRVSRCQPMRSVRSCRNQFGKFVTILTAVLLILLLIGPVRLKFVSPGDLSAQHSGTAFTEGDEDAAGCVHCHSAASGSFLTWIGAGFGASPGPFHLKAQAKLSNARMTAIDHKCRQCHEVNLHEPKNYLFHQPNVVRDHSCSACHQEHRGSGNISAPEDRHCVSCHGDSQIMQASFEKGETLSPEVFDYRREGAKELFRAPRPARGYTRLIHNFATDHPEFQVHEQSLKDPSSLKFNHSIHLGDAIPDLDGKRLSCVNCHEPDGSGSFHSKIEYERHCQSCHSLQFDVETPDLSLPHGDSEQVRAFLRNLSWHYEGHARSNANIKGSRQIEDYVQRKLRSFSLRSGSAEQAERAIFEHVGGESGNASRSRSLFSGCSLCHQVERSADGSVNTVIAPQTPGRWLIRSTFNHVKHSMMNCSDCHSVTRSTQTSDVLLPSKDNCVSCHSPEGKTKHDCSTCHQYHTLDVARN